jgi:ubiquinol-cytochrome c reductase subunit 6
MSPSLSSFFSSIFPTVHADAEEKQEQVTASNEEEPEAPTEEPVEEEEEPEDVRCSAVIVFS